MLIAVTGPRPNRVSCLCLLQIDPRIFFNRAHSRGYGGPYDGPYDGSDGVSDHQGPYDSSDPRVDSVADHHAYCCAYYPSTWQVPSNASLTLVLVDFCVLLVKMTAPQKKNYICALNFFLLNAHLNRQVRIWKCEFGNAPCFSDHWRAFDGSRKSSKLPRTTCPGVRGLYAPCLCLLRKKETKP